MSTGSVRLCFYQIAIDKFLRVLYNVIWRGESMSDAKEEQMRKTIPISLVLCALVFDLLAVLPDVYAEDAPQLISAVLEGPVLTDRIQRTSMTICLS